MRFAGRRRSNTSVGVVVGSLLILALVACSSDDTASSSSSTEATAVSGSTVADAFTTTTTIDPAGRPQPIVGQIDAAIAALEAQLGGPQRYFEINATSRLVNLFVALNDGAVVQPYMYLDGELTSSEGSDANGGTFAATDLDFDPDLVLTKVLDSLPGATIESFYVNGDGKGNVQYGLLVTSAKGGGLDVLVSAVGEVLSVDPVN